MRAGDRVMRCGAAGQLINVIDWIAGWLADCTRCGFGADTDGEGGRRQVRWTRRDAADIGVVSKSVRLSYLTCPSTTQSASSVTLCQSISPRAVSGVLPLLPIPSPLAILRATGCPGPIDPQCLLFSCSSPPRCRAIWNKNKTIWHSTWAAALSLKEETSLALSCTASCPHPPACPTTTTTTTNLRT